MSEKKQISKEELIASLKDSKAKGFKDSSQFNVSLDEIDSFGNKESLLDMVKNISAYNKMLAEKITLINEPLTLTVPFTRENLYLFCAYTGNGKSTIAANISYPLWKEQKKTLVISNEESEQDVIYRIACIELGFSFNDYKKGKMPIEEQKQIISLFPQITQYVKVLDVNFKGGLTTRIEGIKSALESIRNKDYSAVMIDYFQLIQTSAADPSKTRYDVLNELRMWLGQYIKSSNVPIVLFVQLYSLSKRGGTGNDIDNRIKECSNVVEPATVIIEAVPDFELKTTDFIIHKDRFGAAGQRITCGFEKGRFIEITDGDIEGRKQKNKNDLASKKLQALQSSLDSLEVNDV